MDERWNDPALSWEEKISQALEKATDILGEDFSSMEVSVVLSDDRHVQDLNKTFRHKDAPTNVLSFESEMEGELGDIILAYETVMKEAQTGDLPLINHTVHLIIHGFLHLLGYDHAEDDDAHKMENMEINILKTLNIKNPYEVL
ncbi:MAG: rRNA maturation RNase YbeY [Alphaproteobacteria bacterium]|nr:rRNA maturation RNase YbeY [Alphaproteobacteria bacterium]